MKKKILGFVILSIAVITILIMMNFGRVILFLEGETTAKFDIQGDKAIMTGVIYSDTPKVVSKLVKEHPEVKTIVMQNVPGSIDDYSNLEASRIVRDHGLNTYVPADGMIASGGTDFFCSGVERTIEKGAEIGVHSWAGDRVNDATKLPKDHEEHKKYLEYYKEMEIPEDFYWFTIQAAPAESIHNMTEEELKIYGLIK